MCEARKMTTKWMNNKKKRKKKTRAKENEVLTQGGTHVSIAVEFWATTFKKKNMLIRFLCIKCQTTKQNKVQTSNQQERQQSRERDREKTEIEE